MSLLNLAIPHVDAYVRPTFLHNCEGHEDEPPIECRIFGVASVPGRALGFHVLTVNGAVFWRVPIHALCWKTDAPQMPVYMLQLWDCFGDDITFERFEALELSCVVHLPSEPGKMAPYGALYLGTFDWLRNPYSETPEQHKCAHWLRLDNGNFALQPNNRIYPWREPAFVTEASEAPPDYKTNTHVWRCEAEDWITGDGFFYGEQRAGEDNGSPRGP